MNHLQMHMFTNIPSIGNLLGTKANQALLDSINRDNNGMVTFFGSDNDPFKNQHEFFKKRVIEPLKLVANQFEQVFDNIKRVSNFHAITCIDDLEAGIPNQMQFAVACHPTVRKMISDQHPENGFGFEPDWLFIETLLEKKDKFYSNFKVDDNNNMVEYDVENEVEEYETYSGNPFQLLLDSGKTSFVAHEYHQKENGKEKKVKTFNGNFILDETHTYGQYRILSENKILNDQRVDMEITNENLEDIQDTYEFVDRLYSGNIDETIKAQGKHAHAWLNDPRKSYLNDGLERLRFSDLDITTCINSDDPDHIIKKRM